MALNDKERESLTAMVRSNLRLPVIVGDRLDVASATVGATVAMIAKLVSVDKPAEDKPEDAPDTDS